MTKEIIIRRFSGIILFALFLVLLPGTAGAQNWKLDTTVKNVECYHAIIQCNGAPAVILRFVNNNDQEVNINWEESFSTQQVAGMQAGSRTSTQMKILKGETKASDCNEATHKNLVVLPGEAIPSYAATIQSFQFKNVSVIRAK